MDRPLFRRPSGGLALVLDGAIVIAVTAITEWNTWAFHTVAGPKWLTTALPLLLALPLLWRRSKPLLAESLVVAGIVTQAVASGNSAEGLELIIAGGVAAYSVAAYSERRRALVGLAVLAVGYTIYALEDHNIRSGRTGELWAGAFFAVALLAAWLIGIFVHSGRERTALERLAAERDRAAHDAVAEERSRLARELHDIVSHNLSVVVLQAGGARAQGDSAPAGTLEKIERSGREALVEMRRLLGVLREDDGDRTALAPQPGIDQLGALAASMQAAGLPVELTIDGAHDDLPPAFELSVYRIVQEALTNALKHAGPTHAHVQIRRNRQALTIDVIDGGCGNPNRDSPASATAWSGCASGSPCSAVSSPRPLDPRAASPSTPPCRYRKRRDHRRHRRRPGARARRAANDAGRRSRPRCRRRGRRRQRGARRSTALRPRRRADGRPHARARRHRGNRADSSQPAREHACSSLQRSTSTSTSTGPCRPARAASCSRTPSANSSSPRSAPSPQASPCSRPRSPAA